MTIDGETRNEKLQYDINREAAMASGKIDIYEYLTIDETLIHFQEKLLKNK